MNIDSYGAEIERASHIELYGDWIRFRDGEGVIVKIAIDVILELAEFIKEQPKTNFSNVDRNEMLQELLPEIEKLFGMKYKRLEDPPLTPWLPMETPPVRPGVYMADQSWPDKEPESVYAYWDGTDWYPQGSSPSDAMYTRSYGPKKGRPFKQWRGLMEKA